MEHLCVKTKTEIFRFKYETGLQEKGMDIKEWELDLNALGIENKRMG